MLIRQYSLEWMGDEFVGEDEDAEYYILEYLFANEIMVTHKAEVFFTQLLSGSGYFHNLN
jgi:hypothetical protein